MHKRLTAEVRRKMIITAALDCANQPGGWTSLTRRGIAQCAKCSEGLVSLHLGDMCKVRRVVMRAAIKAEMTEIIMQSLACQDGYAVTKWLPPSLKQKALASLLG